MVVHVPRNKIGDRRYISYEGMLSDIEGCQACRLGSFSEQRVIQRGNPHASIILVGEAPGATEESLEIPFIGKSGYALEVMLNLVGLSSQRDCYIINLLKCRPRDSIGQNENRNPKQGEKNACSPYLWSQIMNSQAKIIVPLGSQPSKFILDRKKFNMLEEAGKIFQTDWWNGIIIPLFHPAACIYNAKMGEGTPKYINFKGLILLKKKLEEMNNVD